LSSKMEFSKEDDFGSGSPIILASDKSFDG
jgi:hypothetical protein